MAEGIVLRDCKEMMIQRARDEHDEIFPCADRSHLDECFTTDRNQLLFWFNTRDESTHMLSVAM